MKTKPHLIAAFLLVVSFITACNQESDCDVVEAHFIKEEIRKDVLAPLNGSDTIIFLYNNKDTQIYVGQGVQSDWVLEYAGPPPPSRCDQKYEFLVYNYTCINSTGFSFKIKYHNFIQTQGQSAFPFEYYFKGVNVGNSMIHPRQNDSIKMNNVWYYEPYYRTNGADTMQYFMLCNKDKNNGARILKIKYLNNELTLLK